MSTVYVGLSGGVDSAVSAALLKQQGYDVVGCFIKIWQPEFIECSWREDRLDAMRVAAALGIPFREVDFSDEYKKEVVDAMVAEYAQGITPNPDVACNRSIKFGHFLKWALREGAENIATGHYARINDQEARYSLLRGKDREKDQSYFLWQLGQRELSRSLFPVGGLTKRRVRELAKKFKLPNAGKPDSQGLCFVGDVSMDDFLGRFMPVVPGVVLDQTGRTVGVHNGAALYTVGQRHGFTLRLAALAQGKPHYVTAIHVKTNTIMVSPNREDAARANALLTKVHWIGRAPREAETVHVQSRYREKPVAARIRGRSVHFAKPQLCAPGQSLVVYTGDTCLGGGIICHQKRKRELSHGV